MAFFTPNGFIEDGAFVEDGNNHAFQETVVHDRNNLPILNIGTIFNFTTRVVFVDFYTATSDFRQIIDIPATTAPGPGSVPSSGVVNTSSLVSGAGSVITLNIGSGSFPLRHWYQVPPDTGYNVDWRGIEIYYNGFTYPAQTYQLSLGFANPNFTVNGPLWFTAGKYGGSFGVNSLSISGNVSGNIYLMGSGGSKVLFASIASGTVTYAISDGLGHFDTRTALPNEPYWSARFELSGITLNQSNPSAPCEVQFQGAKIA